MELKKEENIEEKIENAGKIKWNMFTVALGCAMIVSPEYLDNINFLQEYHIFIEVVGLGIGITGASKVYGKVDFLKKTCKDLYQKNKG